jgi:uncharacterized cupredoxin-like copper-binding protein
MADTPRDPVAKPPKRPVWVKIAMVIGALAVLFGILSLTGVLPGGPGGHGPGRHLGGSDESPSPKEQASRGVGAPADEGDADRTIEVETLDTMSFEPNGIEVSAGETVTFVVTNAGQAVHEFTIGDEAMQQEHAEAMEHIPAGMGHDTENSVTLQPGETKPLTWRFGDTTLEYACHQADHYEAGMRGRITVT